MTAKPKTPPRPAPTKAPMTPTAPALAANHAPNQRWFRTQRYGWDKGGSRGGRR